MGAPIFVDLLDPELILVWITEELLEFQAAKDYLCTVRDRGSYLHIWLASADNILAKFQSRLRLVSKRDPSKASPVPERIVATLPTPLQLQARFLTATGVRDSGAKSLIFEGPDYPTADQTWVTFKKSHDKVLGLDTYCPARLVASIMDFNKKLGPFGAPLFPMSSVMMANLLDRIGPGFSSHSFRRTLALAVRIRAESIGVSKKKDFTLYKIVERVGLIAQWATTSDSFFNYSDDFACFKNEPLCQDATVVKYILQDVPAIKAISDKL
jgi:hypothetical protein